MKIIAATTWMNDVYFMTMGIIRCAYNMVFGILYVPISEMLLWTTTQNLWESYWKFPRMPSSVVSVINSLYRSIAIASIVPSAEKKLLLTKHANDLKNIGTRKSSTVTIVEEKVVALQQFFSKLDPLV